MRVSRSGPPSSVQISRLQYFSMWYRHYLDVEDLHRLQLLRDSLEILQVVVVKRSFSSSRNRVPQFWQPGTYEKSRHRQWIVWTIVPWDTLDVVFWLSSVEEDAWWRNIVAKLISDTYMIYITVNNPPPTFDEDATGVDGIPRDILCMVTSKSHNR